MTVSTSRARYRSRCHQAPISVRLPAAAFRLWVVAFNNGGTVVLGIGRMSAEYTAMYVCPLADSAAGRNSTLLNTASDGFGIIYSSPAMAFKPMRVLGYIEWDSPGLATVGTWTITNLRCVQLMGLGVRLPGQVVQSIIVSRQQYSDMVGRWAGNRYRLWGLRLLRRLQCCQGYSASYLVARHCIGTNRSRATLS